MVIKISFALALLTGAGLIFIGIRFMLAPEPAEAAYGIQFNEQGDYSFHYMKGIRDVFSGIIIWLLVFSHQKQTLALGLLAGAMIPLTDMLIVLNKDGNDVSQAMPHIIAIITCLALGVILIRKPKS